MTVTPDQKSMQRRQSAAGCYCWDVLLLEDAGLVQVFLYTWEGHIAGQASGGALYQHAIPPVHLVRWR